MENHLLHDVCYLANSKTSTASKDKKKDSSNLSSGNITRNNSSNGLWRKTEFQSHGCLISTIQSFEQAVEIMNENVLIPIRLMDNQLEKKPTIDLFQFFNSINQIKNKLVWGANNSSEEDSLAPLNKKKVERSSSTVSFESDDLSGSEDSGVEAADEYCNKISSNFQFHLDGLQKCLGELTEFANELTHHYNDIL